MFFWQNKFLINLFIGYTQQGLNDLFASKEINSVRCVFLPLLYDFSQFCSNSQILAGQLSLFWSKLYLQMIWLRFFFRWSILNLYNDNQDNITLADVNILFYFLFIILFIYFLNFNFFNFIYSWPSLAYFIQINQLHCNFNFFSK